MDRPRIRVDFNELVEADLVLLSKSDAVLDSESNEVTLSDGVKVFVYEFNHYADGEKEYLLADGVAERNRPESNGPWTKAAKWCCRIDENGIRTVTTSNT
jgi:hypothetical protein